MKALNALALALSCIIAAMTMGHGSAFGGAMTKSEIIQKIEATALELEIGSIFELELGEPPQIDGDEFTITPGGSQQFAMDGSGGTFNLMPDGRILLIDSEGSFGIVASDFNELVAIATGLPSWRDALRFVGESDLRQARAAWAAYVQQWGLDEALNKPWPYESGGYSIATPGAAREAIRKRLLVEVSADPFAALYRAVNELNDGVAVSWQGEPLLLFGRQR
ncbi:hypothetical protein RMR21_008195 [Agrobacterium sp. rho-8.1]|nr:hypothetical protein [Agrobacterium sp. rho-8.1]